MSPQRNVPIVFSAHYENRLPGDEASVAPDLAKRLVRAGKATYAKLAAEKPAAAPVKKTT